MRAAVLTEAGAPLEVWDDVAVEEPRIGEVAVVIAVATPHREDGFLACRYLIDRLKAVVPIWKKERTADGQEWVSPTLLIAGIPSDGMSAMCPISICGRRSKAN